MKSEPDAGFYEALYVTGHGKIYSLYSSRHEHCRMITRHRDNDQFVEVDLSWAILRISGRRE